MTPPHISHISYVQLFYGLYIVAIRMRPLKHNETVGKSANSKVSNRVWRTFPQYNSIVAQQTATTAGDQPPKLLPGHTLFTFDRTFHEETTTKEVYDGAAKNIVESFVSGLDGTIAVYMAKRHPARRTQCLAMLLLKKEELYTWQPTIYLITLRRSPIALSRFEFPSSNSIKEKKTKKFEICWRTTTSCRFAKASSMHMKSQLQTAVVF